VPIPLPDRGRLPPGAARDFVEALHGLYDRAGQPASRRISRTIYRKHELASVSHETVSSVLRGDSVPAWDKIHSIVTALGEMSVGGPVPVAQFDELTRYFHRLWIAARRPVDNVSPSESDDRPSTADGPADPPPPPSGPRQAAGDLPDPDPRAAGGGRPAAGDRADRDTRAGDRVVGGDMPDRDPGFTGRELLLDRMRARHSADPHLPLALYGVGGVGKTQIAREYVSRYADRYTVVWWIPAEQPEQARGSMIRLAERLRLPIRQNAEQTIAGVIERLQSPRDDEFLLIFDGARGDDIRPLIPSIGGHVLVTTRDPRWAHDPSSNGLEVVDFDLAEAIQFLRKHDRTMTPEQAVRVFGRLGRLPIALVQLAALRRATGRSWDDLLAMVDEAGADDDAGMFDTSMPIRLAIKEMRERHPDAASVFELFAWFGSDPVPVPLLRRGATGEVSARLRRLLGDPIQLRKAVAEINRYGLGRLHTTEQRVEVQPLVRLVLRESLSEPERDQARADVHAILIAADQGWPDDLPLWDLHRWMAPHVLPAELLTADHPSAQSAVLDQIRYRYLLGDYEGARTLGETAVATWQDPDFLGPDHEMVLRATREWANALRSLGRYAEARELTTDAMRRLRESSRYGPDHEYTLSMARSHAADLRIDGRYQDAYELDRQNYERHVGRYNTYSERTATSRHNVAVSLRLLGRFAGAEAVDRAELTHRRIHLGDDHRKTLLTLNALAEDLFGLGRYRDVLELWSPALEIGDRQLRPGDLGILLARRTFGIAHRRLGDTARAIELLRAHYFECVRSFGAMHEISLAATMSYANALRERPGQRGEAYATVVDAVNAYETAFGIGNPLTLAAQVNQAVMLRANGETQSALRADEAACRALRSAVGDGHPFTVVAMINLATDRALTGDRAGALAMSQQAYDTAVQTHGPQHSDTLAAAANLTIDGGPGEPSLDAVLTDLRRTLGAEHPMVAAVAAGIRVECDIEPPSLA
jgi:tetratricopeptide (TPR) repeat protein